MKENLATSSNSTSSAEDRIFGLPRLPLAIATLGILFALADTWTVLILDVSSLRPASVELFFASTVAFFLALAQVTLATTYLALGQQSYPWRMTIGVWMTVPFWTAMGTLPMRPLGSTQPLVHIAVIVPALIAGQLPLQTVRARFGWRLKARAFRSQQRLTLRQLLGIMVATAAMLALIRVLVPDARWNEDIIIGILVSSLIVGVVMMAYSLAAIPVVFAALRWPSTLAVLGAAAYYSVLISFISYIPLAVISYPEWFVFITWASGHLFWLVVVAASLRLLRWGGVTLAGRSAGRVG